MGDEELQKWQKRFLLYPTVLANLKVKCGNIVGIKAGILVRILVGICGSLFSYTLSFIHTRYIV